MSNIIDVDYREADAQEAATNTDAQQTTSGTEKKKETKESFIDKAKAKGKAIGKKIWKPVVGTVVVAGVAYFGYKVIKGAADNIPDTINDKAQQGLEGLITVHGIAPEDMSEEQIAALHEAHDKVFEILEEAEGKIFGDKEE